MKKVLFAVFAALFALCSCEELLTGNGEGDVLYGKIEESLVTKTHLASGNKALWSEGDQIAVFMQSSDAQKYQVSVEDAGNSSAAFAKVSGKGTSVADTTWGEYNVAFYPYSFVSGVTASEGNHIAEVNFPTVQTFAADCFGEGFFPMAAVSKDNTFYFHYICGAVNLRLVGSQKIVSVSLKGNAGEKISGAGTITAYSENEVPVLKMASSASSSVTLDCGEGVQLNASQATSFVIVLPPVEFSKGFIMTVTDSEGSEYEISMGESKSISRSTIYAVSTYKLGEDSEAGFEEGSEGNEIPKYIDEYGINHGPGVEIDGVIWAPVNCGYHERDFKYGKLYQLGRKYGQGYSGEVFSINGLETYSDASVPSIQAGPVSLTEGQSKSNSNVFYTSEDYPYDWRSHQNGNLWNAGTESDPIKTEYDPCPEGWRVPTYSELDNLRENYSSWTTDEKGLVGCWFSGSRSYSSGSPRIFFPAAGHIQGPADRKKRCTNRYTDGSCWSSRLDPSCLYFYRLGNHINGNCGANGFSVRCVQDVSELIPVSSVSIDKSSLTMETGDTQILSAVINPSDANHKTAYWWSDDESVATVDETGNVTAFSSGVVTITAMAGMELATCTVTVNPPKDYVDEAGVNHGPSVKIDGVVWAPVNCGYHETDFKYGKLYQWGRKYGQGYSGDIYDINGNYVETYSDASVPSIESGPVSMSTGQSESNSNVFYTCWYDTSDPNHDKDWLSPHNDNLWNAGTEDNPVKTEYDPCPEGWRVPTYSELDNLCENYSSWTTDENGQIGRWFSGSRSYSSSPLRVFFPAAGFHRYYRDTAVDRGKWGNYLSSRPYSNSSYWFSFGSGGINVAMFSDGRGCGYSVRCVQDDSELIPVSSVSINESSLTMEVGETQTLSATISPSDANHKTAYWWSEDELLATVDDSGKVTAVSSGVTTITAMAGMKQVTCTVTVNAPASNAPNYIDENGINYGPGIEIDGVVWAPVNCGYHKIDYKYGKLYQWGRKYGQGYSGDIYDINGNYVETYSDASVPSIESGPVSMSTGQSERNSNVFYTGVSGNDKDWLSPHDDNLWNAGTEDNPIKTEYDPCPEGWRVPTYSELDNLNNHRSSWTTDEKGQTGCWFSGSRSYSSSSPRVFFPAAGDLGFYDGSADLRGRTGRYWSSRQSHLLFLKGNNGMYGGVRANGYSVRCVHE